MDTLADGATGLRAMYADTTTVPQLLQLAAPTSKGDVFWWCQLNGAGIDDPYARNHMAARNWLRRYEQLTGHVPDTEVAVRAYGMAYYGGFSTAAGCMVRGWRERHAHPRAKWGEEYQREDNPDVYLRCPYRRSYHRGASRGGGTFGHIYANAWGVGVRFADANLAGARGGV